MGGGWVWELLHATPGVVPGSGATLALGSARASCAVARVAVVVVVHVVVHVVGCVVGCVVECVVECVSSFLFFITGSCSP